MLFGSHCSWLSAILFGIVRPGCGLIQAQANCSLLFTRDHIAPNTFLDSIFRNLLQPVNSNTTGTITPMFSSYDWMKPNLKQKAGTARGKWLVRKDWGKLRGVKSLFLSENMLEK